MERAEDMAKTKLRPDGLAVGSGAQKRATPILGKTRFLKIDVLPYRPFAGSIHQPRKFALTFGDGFEITITKQVHLPHPKPRRLTLEVLDGKRVALPRRKL